MSNARGLTGVVENVNGTSNGFDAREAEIQAAEYAVEGAIAGGYGLYKENLEYHLDVLVEAGAIFNYQKALKLAIITAKDYE